MLVYKYLWFTNHYLQIWAFLLNVLLLPDKTLQLNYLYKCRYKCRVSTSSGKIREYIFFEGEGL